MKMLKKALTLVLALTMVLATLVTPVSAAVLTDVPENEWYAAAVNRWFNAEVLEGYGDGTFNPTAPITRAEMAKVLYAALGLSEKDAYDTAFSDVLANDWFYDEVLAIADEGIVEGMGNGKYEPQANITREAAFTILARSVGKGLDADQEVYDEILGAFSDYNEISDWALGNVASLVAANVVKGDDANKDGVYDIRPKDTITRAEVAALLDRLFPVYITASGEVSVTTETNYSSGLILVNAKQENDWKVVYTVDEETGDVTVTVTPMVDQEVAGEATTVILEGCGNNNDSYLGDIVIGTDTNNTLMPDEDNCVDADESNVHTHDQFVVCEDCAVGYTPVIDCPVCGTMELDYVDAHAHDFEPVYENGVVVAYECTCCHKTVDECLKFRAKVESNGEYVEAKVTNDYAAELVVTPGKVNANEVKIEVEMNDVASLGGGNKSHEQTFTTGLNGDPALNVWLSNAFDFESGTVEATIQGKEVTYELAGETNEDDAAVITATPADVEATREAWQELTSHVSTTTQEASDSYIKIANGSYMIVDDDKLSFEKGDNIGDLVLDGFASDMSSLEDQIRATVQLNTVPVDEKYQAQFYLAAGTELAVSNSIATLEDNCLITFAGTGLNTEDFKNVLTDLQKADGGYAMASELVQMLNAMIASADGKVIEVGMTFTEPVEKDTKFYLGVTAENAEKEGTTTVDMEVYDDYSLEINLPMNKISASSVKLEVAMNNVASLGGGQKYHEQTINTGMTATGDLGFWMSNAAKFGSTTINATIDGNACTYVLESDYDADWVTITGTTDTEAARAAWQALTAHVTTSTQDVSDSYVLIDNASYIDTTAEKLMFEEGAEDLKLDNFSDLDALKTNIKNSVKLVESSADQITLFVGKGTTLAVSNSIATLDCDCTITISGMNLSSNVLDQIRTASDQGNEALVKALFNILNDFVGAANDKTINVNIDFAGHTAE